MISVVYAVHNEEKNLTKSLESVYDWVNEIIVVDGESSDQTVTVAKSFKAKVITTTNKVNFHINKQLAIDAAKGDLILQLDADEVVDKQLQEFIINLDKMQDKSIAAWQIRRKNLFFGSWLKKGGQYPDMVIRLFWRGQAYLPQKDVHEQMKVMGDIGIANGHLWHYANPDLESYWRKFNTYTSFKAKQLEAEKTKINFWTFSDFLVLKPLKTFLSLFVRHRGYVDGMAGFLFAWFSALHHQVAYLKYIESQKSELNQNLKVFFPVSELAHLQKERGVGKYYQWLIEEVGRVKSVFISENNKNADIIHYTFFDLFRPTLKKVPKSQKLVVTIHDVIPLLFPQDYPVGWRGKFAFWCQKRNLQKADLIITDSLASKNDIINYLKIKAQKIEVIYLAANPKLKLMKLSQIAQVKKTYNLPTNYILYVGDINFNKNLAQLIKALKFLSTKIHLVLVGKNFKPQQIPEWQVLEEQLHLSEVEERVHFLTQIESDEALSAIYAGAIAYVQPSYYEGFGLPVLEAMKCGTVVITHNNSSLEEVGGKHVFYSASLQARDWADQIEKVYNLDKEKRSIWIEKAYRWQEKFTWQLTAEKVIKCYEKLVE